MFQFNDFMGYTVPSESTAPGTPIPIPINSFIFISFSANFLNIWSFNSVNNSSGVPFGFILHAHLSHNVPLFINKPNFAIYTSPKSIPKITSPLVFNLIFFLSVF